MKAPRRTLRTKSGTRGGFTLLEVLIALAIFVGATAILSRLVLLGLESAEFSRRQTEAWLLAETHMAEFEAGVLTIENAGTYVDEEYPNWQWSLISETTGTAALYRVIVEVKSTSGSAADQSAFRLARLYFDETAIETDDTAGTTP